MFLWGLQEVRLKNKICLNISLMGSINKLHKISKYWFGISILSKGLSMQWFQFWAIKKTRPPLSCAPSLSWLSPMCSSDKKERLSSCLDKWGIIRKRGRISQTMKTFMKPFHSELSRTAVFLAGQCNLSQGLGNSYFYRNYLRVDLSISASRELKAALLQILHFKAWLVNCLAW